MFASNEDKTLGGKQVIRKLEAKTVTRAGKKKWVMDRTQTGPCVGGKSARNEKNPRGSKGGREIAGNI